MDGYLYEAARRYYTATRGLADSFLDAWDDLWQAVMLGRLALSALNDFAMIILHEMMHVEFPGNHCSNACCMQRHAVYFGCRVASYLGLPHTGHNINTDLDLNDDTGPGQTSICRDSHSDDPDSLFDGQCRMLTPGEQGDEDQWEKQVYYIPEECE